MTKLLIIVLIATAVVAIPNFNQITDCRSSSDCAMSDCCVIGTCNAMLHTNCKFIFYQKCYFVLGMMRFSTPMCQPRLKVNETCRPSGNQITNGTFSYPNGSQITLIDGYQVRNSYLCFYFNEKS